MAFELVEGGHVLNCDFDLATGTASLSVDGGQGSFLGEHEQPDSTTRSAGTKIQGPGKYRIMLANCDDQLVLWVNGKVVAFDGPTTYAHLDNNEPTSADHWPVGISAQGTKLSIDSLRVYRDVFYIATDFDKMARLISNVPGGVTFSMSDDQFFVLGDNSPASKDSRLWRVRSSDPHWVDRELLIGKSIVYLLAALSGGCFSILPEHSTNGIRTLAGVRRKEDPSCPCWKLSDLPSPYGRRRVVDGIDLVVERGEIVGLLGPNGAGKTTCFSHGLRDACA